jgi:hypothetical protein
LYFLKTRNPDFEKTKLKIFEFIHLRIHDLTNLCKLELTKQETPFYWGTKGATLMQTCGNVAENHYFKKL